MISYLRIIIPSRLIDFKSNGSASSTSFPRYVGLKSFHLTITFPLPTTLKSACQLRLLRSRPSGLSGSNSSFKISVYSFPSDSATSNSIPSYADKSHLRDPVVRCDANPAPPRVSMSRLPLNVAWSVSGEISRVDWEEPPRTRSSEEVQSLGDHCLAG